MHEEFTFDGHVRDLPVMEGETIQLGRGKASFLSDRACGRDLILVRLRLEPLMIGFVVPDPAWLVIGIPIRWRGDYFCNGQALRPYDAFVSEGPNGYVTVGEGRDTVVMGVRKSRLKAACAALQGVPPDAIDFNDVRLSFGPVAGRYLQERVTSLIALSSHKALTSEQSRLGTVLESDLISDMATLLTRHHFGGRCNTPANLNALNIVRTALKIADDSTLSPPSLADLCAATGVGQTWLYKAFVDILGLPPIRLLHDRRLTQAHNMLVDSAKPAPSVKYVARTLGFVGSGRFAQEYRSLFGENPSDTLKGRPETARLLDALS